MMYALGFKDTSRIHVRCEPWGQWVSPLQPMSSSSSFRYTGSTGVMQPAGSRSDSKGYDGAVWLPNWRAWRVQF